MSLSLGCGLFSPQSSKVTIEVSNTYIPTSGQTGCVLYANVDGGNTVVVGNGSVYTFPLVDPGSHTVNLNTEGSAGCGTVCTIGSSTNGNANYADTFQTNSGNLYVVKIASGSPNACSDLVVTGP